METVTLMPWYGWLAVLDLVRIFALFEFIRKRMPPE